MTQYRKFYQLQSQTLAGAGVSVGDTTMTLSSFTDIDGSTLVTMNDFGTKGYMTLEPNNSSNEEAIAFTGITQNANGTATITGISNVLFKYPYTETSGFLKNHAGGTHTIVTNTSGFYNDFTNKLNDETVTGQWTFTNTPIVPGTVSDASTTVKGVTKISVAPVSASNPIAVGDNDPRVPTADPTTLFNPQVGIIFGGTGADGSATIAIDTTLAADKNYTTLVVNSGVVLNTAGYAVYATTSITNNGTIRNNGGTGGLGAASGTGTGGIAGTAAAGATFAAGVAGGVGGAGGVTGNDGSAGVAGGNLNPSLGASGAAGGTGRTSGSAHAGGAGGAGGTATLETLFSNVGTGTITAGTVTAKPQTRPLGSVSGVTLSTAPGAGGGGGGGASSGQSGAGGGGGGGGGGVVFLCTPTITNSATGTIQANGGTGGAGGLGTDGAGGGGGAGGTGGNVILFYFTLNDSGTIQAAGGTGGALGAFGTGGSAGTAGTTGKVYKVTV